jgi:hypothetical protein
MVAVYEALEGFPGPDAQPAYYEMLRNIGALSANPGTKLLVVVDRNTLLGGVVYLADTAHYGAGGIACIDEARARGHEQVIIHTTAAMIVAWGMYERLGFTRAAELDFVQQGMPVYGFRLRLFRRVMLRRQPPIDRDARAASPQLDRGRRRSDHRGARARGEGERWRTLAPSVSTGGTAGTMPLARRAGCLADIRPKPLGGAARQYAGGSPTVRARSGTRRRRLCCSLRTEPLHHPH